MDSSPIAASLSSRESDFLSVRQLLAILAARSRQILLIACGIVVLTALLVAFMPRVWTSSAVVFVDYRDDDPISGQKISPLINDSYLQTQRDLLGSQAVVDQAINDLGLMKTRAAQEMGRAALVEDIRRRIQISGGRDSRVLNVSYSANSPEKAQSYVNAVVNAYIGLTQNLSSSAARTRREQYNAQLDVLRAEIDLIQEKLTSYQQETGILNTQDHGDLETLRLNNMTNALIQIQTQKSEALARNEAVKKLLDNGVRVEYLPQLNQLPNLQSLFDGLTRVDNQLADVRGTLGVNHPTMKGLQAERAQLLGRIAKQSQASLATLRNDVARLENQERTLQTDIDTLRAAVLEKMQQHDRITAYQRQLSSAEQVYRAALQKYDSLFLASNISTPSAAVIQAAELPRRPSSPKVMRSMLLSVIAGLLAGAGIALLLEFLRRRVRCLEDVQGDAEMPLLGVIRPAAYSTSEV